MRVAVDEVSVTPSSSISFGYGANDSGEAITFAGDRRMMQDLAEQIAQTGEAISAQVEDWQLWAVGEERVAWA